MIQTIAKKVDCNVIINSAYRLVTKKSNSEILIAEINYVEINNNLRKMKKLS